MMGQQRFAELAGQAAGRSTASALPGDARLVLMRGLACPACGRELDVELSATGTVPAGLACGHCGRRWPVRQRTPAFVSPAPADAIPSGVLALMHAPDVERWDAFRHAIEQADPVLHAEVFNFSEDDWRFLIPAPPHARILVIGCGWGRLASSLAGMGEAVYAVDRDESRARFVNARAFAEGNPNLLAVAAGIEGLPFPRAAFHLVVLAAPDALACKRGGMSAVAALVRLRAFLAPGGILLLRGSGGSSLRRRMAPAWRRLLARAGFSRSRDLLALPDLPAYSHLWQGGPDAGAYMTAGALVRGGVRPRRVVQRALWRAAAVPGVLRRLMPSEWCLATGEAALTPAVMDDASLPAGPWSVLVGRDRGCRDGCARFIAVEPGTARPRFLVKVARDPDDGHGIENEFRMLKHLEGVLSPELRRTIPRAIARYTVQGRHAIARTYLVGRSIRSLIEDAPPSRRVEVAVDLLAGATHWLARFHHETARETVLTDDLLDGLLLRDLDRALGSSALPDQSRALWAEAAVATRAWIGRKMPLVCEHGRLGGGNVLVGGDAVGVVEWDLAACNRLPLGDLLDLIHSVAFAVAGRGEGGPDAGEMLRIAYGGRGTFSRAVGLAMDAYCSLLGLRPEWSQALLPLLMARKAWTAVQYPHLGAPQEWLGIGLRFLQAPTRFPVALGVRRHETWKGEVR